MIKQTITFEDFDGTMRTEDYYFNMTKLELLETSLQHKGGFDGVLEELRVTEDPKKAFKLFKKLILATYGEKTDDGKSFVKDKKRTKAFANSPALSEMIIGFLNDPMSGAKFMEGCMPKSLVSSVRADLDKIQAELGSEATPDLTRKKLRDMTQAELQEAARLKAAAKS